MTMERRSRCRRMTSELLMIAVVAATISCGDGAIGATVGGADAAAGSTPDARIGTAVPDAVTAGAPDAAAGAAADAPTGPGPTGLQVEKGTGGAAGHLTDAAGQHIALHGANRAGSEYACLYGGFFDGPSDQASITAMKAWHINAVRVPMNEDCWLGINGVPADFGGAKYQAAIRAYVSLLEASGMIVILDLHWAAPGTSKANGQLGMADADHAPTFWSQVAAAYAGDSSRVIFDLFNEPFITDWDCWLEGGACATDYGGTTYTAAGMASLLKAVRATGAKNVVILGGLAYSSDFSGWLERVNKIPTLAPPLDGLTTENVAASWHTYSDQSVQTLCPTQYNGYSTDLHCTSGAVTAANYGIPDVLAAGFPVIIGEIGIGAYADAIAPYTVGQANELAAWLESTLSWVDDQGQGYLGWDWNTEAPPLLITSFDGTPTPYFGATYKAHLMGLVTAARR
jgi:endoglucanase